VALIVPDWLRQRAQLTPARLALVAEPCRWTFAELDARVDAAAAALRSRGITRQQRVGVLAPNGPGFVLAVHALARLQAVLVPLNLRLTQQELDFQIADAELACVLDEHAVDALTNAPRTEAHLCRDFDLDAPHTIMYTSGTTGRPKGAILTYGNHWWSATASALNLGLAPDDRWIACLPLFHVGGLSILLRSVIYGITAEVHAKFDAAAVNRSIDAGASFVSVVSTMLDRMLDERAGRAYPPSLRCVLLGGGPAPLELLTRANAAQAPVIQTYGLTETASQLVTLAPEDALRKLGSAGKPLMGARVQIADEGEIWVDGPSVSPGYWRQPPRQGWLRTGDIGRFDEDGFLYVLDRRDDLIVSGGENVYPAEVEAALLTHPAVAEAGVYGTPDPTWGMRVAAAVVTKGDASVSAHELQAFCRARLAGYKVPRTIEFRSSLPRTAIGKLKRRDLR
jgi:o-succinylbenzoate---CoA ligase